MVSKEVFYIEKKPEDTLSSTAADSYMISAPAFTTASTDASIHRYLQYNITRGYSKKSVHFSIYDDALGTFKYIGSVILASKDKGNHTAEQVANAPYFKSYEELVLPFPKSSYHRTTPNRATSGIYDVVSYCKTSTRGGRREIIAVVDNELKIFNHRIQEDTGDSKHLTNQVTTHLLAKDMPIARPYAGGSRSSRPYFSFSNQSKYFWRRSWC